MNSQSPIDVERGRFGRSSTYLAKQQKTGFWFVLDFGAKVAPNHMMANVTQFQNPKIRANVRFDKHTWMLIDESRTMRMGYVSRNSWILEAIQEKLTKELNEKLSKSMRQNA